MTKGTELQKEWETRIAAYRASGQSAKEWCAVNNVKPHRLWYWLRRCKTNSHIVPKEDAHFVRSTQWLPVEVNGQAPMDQDNALLIRVGKACIEVKPGFDPVLLNEIVRALVTLC